MIRMRWETLTGRSFGTAQTMLARKRMRRPLGSVCTLIGASLGVAGQQRAKPGP